jgi:hypothetical protein
MFDAEVPPETRELIGVVVVAGRTPIVTSPCLRAFNGSTVTS